MKTNIRTFGPTSVVLFVQVSYIHFVTVAKCTVYE
jgi:hypothetical protein